MIGWWVIGWWVIGCWVIAWWVIGCWVMAWWVIGCWFKGCWVICCWVICCWVIGCWVIGCWVIGCWVIGWWVICCWGISCCDKGCWVFVSWFSLMASCDLLSIGTEGIKPAKWCFLQSSSIFRASDILFFLKLKKIYAPREVFDRSKTTKLSKSFISLKKLEIENDFRSLFSFLKSLSFEFNFSIKTELVSSIKRKNTFFFFLINS